MMAPNVRPSGFSPRSIREMVALLTPISIESSSIVISDVMRHFLRIDPRRIRLRVDFCCTPKTIPRIMPWQLFDVK